MPSSVLLSILLLLALLIPSGGVAYAQPESTPTDRPVRAAVEPFVLDTIVIRTADLYEGIRRTPIISDVLEFFHMVTRERAIRQEIFLATGDTVRQQDLDQLEENLRLLGIFAEIEVSAQLDEEAEDADARHGRVLVRTRDAVSLRGGASYTQTEDSRDFFLGLK